MAEVYPWELWNQAPARKQKEKQRRKIRYGLGALGGIIVVDFVKQRIRKLPILGPIASPFLFLLPTMLIGPALGVAAVYGYEKGDPLAAKELLPKAKEEVGRASRRLERQLEDTQGELSSRLRRLQTRAQRHVDDAVADIATDVDHQVRQLSRDGSIQRVVGRLESEFDNTLRQIQVQAQQTTQPRDRS